MLKAALLRRATEDINRVLALRNQKQALAMLLQRGSVGDDLWQRFLRAEKEMEDEVRDVVAEVGLVFFNCFVDELVQGKKECLLTRGIIGECVCTELGPDNLPVCERNDE